MAFSITPMLVGVRNVDQGIMTYQRGYGRRIWLPMWSFLLRELAPGGRIVLVDTGLEDFVAPPEFFADTGLTALLMEDALAERGVSPEAVRAVVNTHLHDDHCGNNQLFPQAKFYVQRAEIEACRHPHPLDYRYDEASIEGLDLVALDGDAEVLPGLSVLFTPGHTPGAQTVLVDTPGGRAVITGMCSNRENYPGSGPAVCPGVHCDAFAAYDTAQRIIALRDQGAALYPLHALEVAKAVQP
ncbi:N-acyl homoserine lactonase family protein [Solidesulfovibrio sp.]|uniref:N-acyl homoserine lactonase family protein n=1 Tax=Solidesulfovibrio sp. TaxID=2910990 RepID=UPI002B208DB2|nr:N-acyl homoserine lactonase family protein [Solidesulfovibrio sp.]MEA4857150.1 N-acyl homoserine lactonase family protein [Solidesulfovibrio sp.]